MGQNIEIPSFSSKINHKTSFYEYMSVFKVPIAAISFKSVKGLNRPKPAISKEQFRRFFWVTLIRNRTLAIDINMHRLTKNTTNKSNKLTGKNVTISDTR